MPYCLQKQDVMTVDEIDQKIDRYREYMSDKLPNGDRVHLSNVFEKEALMKVLSESSDGVRVLLVKDDDPSEVSMMVVPVKKVRVTAEGAKDDADDFQFENQLEDEDKMIYIACPSKYCQP